MKLAKADLVPTETNLLPELRSRSPSWRRPARSSRTMVNARVHRVTRRAPAEMLAEEQARLHPLPDEPHTVAFGVTRTVPVNTPMVTFEHGQYSVPQRLLGQQVWVRAHGLGAAEQVVIVHVDPQRGRSRSPGTSARPRAQPRIDDAISPAAGQAARPVSDPATHRRRGSVPGARGRRAGVADRGRCRGDVADPGEDGRLRSTMAKVAGNAGSTGRSGMPRSMAGSAGGPGLHPVNARPTGTAADRE